MHRRRPEALEIWRNRAPQPTCVLVENDGHILPCSIQSANLLLCLEVFPVIGSDWFLPEVAGVLSDEGLLVGVALMSVCRKYGPRFCETFPPGVPLSDRAVSVPDPVAAVQSSVVLFVHA
jgi:hypothetical protein